jgi:hypothetical protein
MSRVAYRYDTYGFGTATIDDARRLVEQRLRVDLQPRESGYYADTYYRWRTQDNGSVMLYRNLDAYGAPIRRPFVEYDVLLDVSELDDMDAIRRALCEGYDEPALLRSAELEGDEAG